MSKDVTNSSHNSTLSKYFATFTHFIDENIRAIQYCVYCAGAAGVVISLHSIRAFTKFNQIKDIPREFITKHIRLHGHVSWVGPTPPSGPQASIASAAIKLLPGSANKSLDISEATAKDVAESTTFPTENIYVNAKERGDRNPKKLKPQSLSADNRGIYEGAGELHPWEDGIDPDVVRIEYEEELFPVYLKVDHTPALSILKKKPVSQLPLQLADIEVSKAGFQLLKKELIGQGAWFTLVSHNFDEDLLNAWVRPAKFYHRKSINERLLREGLALTSPMDLDLHHDKSYVKQYMKLMKAQEYAEKKEIGLWTKPSKPAFYKRVFQKIVIKMKSVIGRKQ